MRVLKEFERFSESSLQPSGRMIKKLIEDSEHDGTSLAIAIIQAVKSLSDEGYFDDEFGHAMPLQFIKDLKVRLSRWNY